MITNLNFKYLAQAKLHQVKKMVERYAEDDDYQEFVRCMFSVGLYDEEIEFNYIHPMVLQSAITPTLRSRVLRNGLTLC